MPNECTNVMRNLVLKNMPVVVRPARTTGVAGEWDISRAIISVQRAYLDSESNSRGLSRRCADVLVIADITIGAIDAF